MGAQLCVKGVGSDVGEGPRFVPIKLNDGLRGRVPYPIYGTANFIAIGCKSMLIPVRRLHGGHG